MSGYFSKIVSRSQPKVPHRGRAVDFGKKEGINETADFFQPGIEPVPAMTANKATVEKPGEQRNPILPDTNPGDLRPGPVTGFASEETNSRPLPVIQKPSLQDFPNRVPEVEQKKNEDPKEVIVQEAHTNDHQKRSTDNRISAPAVHSLRYPAEKNIEKIGNEKKEVTKLIIDQTAPVAPAVKRNPTPMPLLPNNNPVMHQSPTYPEKKRDNPKLVIGKITVEVTGPPAAPVKTTRQKNNRYTAPGMPKTNISSGFKLSFGLGQL